LSGLEAFLDDTPGEARGVLVRDGRYERLIIQREEEAPEQRLGARWVGRVSAVDAALHGAFVDGGGEPPGFLPLRRGDRPTVGQAVEVEVVAEPREAKGPTLKLVGDAAGDPRLLAAGPTVRQILARLAPGAPIQTGAVAIRAGLEAEEEAGAAVSIVGGVSVAIERTRALLAVDIDHAPTPGREGRRDKARANREGLAEAARRIGLKGWGGLVAVDLVGAGHDGAAMAAAARAAFRDPQAVIGPVNRFGVLMLSLPWRTTPVEERLAGDQARAVDAVRRLRLALAEDAGAPYLTLRCAPEMMRKAGPLAARLGPRARVVADPALRPGDIRMDQG
jgi:hypothetical protein